MTEFNYYGNQRGVTWQQSIRDAANFDEQKTIWMRHNTRAADENMSQYGLRMLQGVTQIIQGDDYVDTGTFGFNLGDADFYSEEYRESIEALPDDFWEDINKNAQATRNFNQFNVQFRNAEQDTGVTPANLSSDSDDDIDPTALVFQTEENLQDDPDANGLSTSPGFDAFFMAADEAAATFEAEQAERNAGAVNNVLEDPGYQKVVTGWNQKIRSSSEDISGLTPFCELYAVFPENDLIYSEDGTKYTAIKNRLYNVRFQGVRSDIKPPLPEGITPNSKVAKIAGDNQSQIQPDSITKNSSNNYEAYSSFKGLPGINDLAVSRGSAAAQNVKYDLTITLPNPELINERFEYSKLMLMNSAFLIIYGWNIRDGAFDADNYPPTIQHGVENNVVVGNGMGGFWSSAIISLSNFQFDFDSVGHLVGKLTFLNNSGIFLGTMTVEPIGNKLLDSLTKPAQSILDRVNNNQNFIWQNGIPWSATQGNEEMVDVTGPNAANNDLLREFFAREGDGGYSSHLDRIFSERHYTDQDAVLALRDKVRQLNELGETFLKKYRQHLLLTIFFRKENNLMADSAEAARAEELAEFNTDYFNYSGGKQDADDFDDHEANMNLDTIPYYSDLIDINYNNLFLSWQAGYFNQDNPNMMFIFMFDDLVDSPVNNIDIGFNYFDFYDLMYRPSDIAGQPPQQEIKFVGGLLSGRGQFVPAAFEEFLVDTPVGTGETSYITNMPPFGVDLQSKIITAFSDPNNVNYRHFSGSRPTIAQNVLDLITSTSVISVPSVVYEDGQAILPVFEKTYSQVMETEPELVLISFEFLNKVESAEGDQWDDSLHRIKFHSQEMLTSLEGLGSDDGIGQWAEHFRDEWNTDTNTLDIVTTDDGAAFFQNHFSKVYNADAISSGGRFVDTKYAILKNGYFVSTHAANRNAKFVDKETADLIVTPDGEDRLYFLNMAPDGVTVEQLAERHEARENIARYVDAGMPTRLMSPEERRIYNSLDWNLAGIQLTDLTGGDTSAEQKISMLIEQNAEMVRTMDAITKLKRIILDASQGAEIARRVELGVGNIDEIAVEDEDGGTTTRKVFRQPVFFFLGSVLEALRIATNNRVKFQYSAIPQKKEGKPFIINIPEQSATSITSQFDREIESLKKKLVELNVAVEDEAEQVTILQNQGQQEVEAAVELEKKQKEWDDALVQYIIDRGTNVASLGYNTAGQKAYWAGQFVEGGGLQSQGVYGPTYTNLKGNVIQTQVQFPTYRFYEGKGGEGGPSVVGYQTTGISDTGQPIRAPFVYKIKLSQDHQNYYGKTSPYESIPTALDNLGSRGDDGRDEGFMRLWRPEDLQMAITAAEMGNDWHFLWRKKPSFGFAKDGGYPSFLTDSFGIRSPGTGGPDYGLQYIKHGGDNVSAKDMSQFMKKDSDTVFPEFPYSNPYENRTIDRPKALVQRLVQWLNWFPADGNLEYTILGKSLHEFYGNNKEVPWDNPNTLDSDELVSQGWYYIAWPNRRPRGFEMMNLSSQSTTVYEPFYVRGVVVDDFIQLNGVRPTAENPEPLEGETGRELQIRNARVAMINERIDNLERQKNNSDVSTQFSNLPIRTTYEIPVKIDTIRQFLTSEPNAPLHNLLKKVLASTREVTPSIQLSMRPSPSDNSYIDVFPSAMNYDGVIQEVFTEFDINRIDASDEGGIIAAGRSINRGGLVTSEKVMVCQFGTGQSLIENFGLSSKIDPTAFSSFRLPAVVGGARMNVIEVLRTTQENDPVAFAGLLNDFRQILGEGLTSGMAGLKNLKIVTEAEDGSFTVTEQGKNNLINFLLAENAPVISKAATGFLEDMMSQNVGVYNKMLLLQNQFFTNLDTSAEGSIGNPESNTRLAGSKFYGNVLSTFLRTATLTIHGTTGLNVFNLVYLKGLVSGVEGLYLISSVNESIAASTFTTTLECKLVEYVNNDDKTNPLAYRGNADLNRLASVIDQRKAEEGAKAEFGVGYEIGDLDRYIQEFDAKSGFLQG